MASGTLQRESFLTSCGSAGKEFACNAGDLDLIPGLGRFPWRRERLATPVFWPEEFHGLYSPWGHKEMDTTKRLSLSLHPVAQMVIHLQCRRPGFDPWVGKIPWRRERLPTPVSWPREFHGLYSPWSRKESDTTEQLSLHFTSLHTLSSLRTKAV